MVEIELLYEMFISTVFVFKLSICIAALSSLNTNWGLSRSTVSLRVLFYRIVILVGKMPKCEIAKLVLICAF